MSDDFTFSPLPKIAPKRRKRSQTAPLIASIVTPAVVMIGFLIYLDHKGFFSPSAAPKAMAAKADYKPQIEKPGKHFRDPVPVPRVPRRPNPPPPQIGGDPGIAPPRGEPVDRADLPAPERPARKPTGLVLHAHWEIAFPSREILRAQDLMVTKNEVTGDLAKNDKVWVYLFPGQKPDPAGCFPINAKPKEVPGLVPPAWNGTAFIASRLRRPALAIDYQVGNRTGELRVFDEGGSTICLIRFFKGNRRGLACICSDGQPVYIEDTQGPQTTGYFLASEGNDVRPVAIDGTDPKETERAGEYQDYLAEIVADADSRELEWRKQFRGWSRDCTDIIRRRASGGKTPVERQKFADQAIEELRAEQGKLRADLLGH